MANSHRWLIVCALAGLTGCSSVQPRPASSGTTYQPSQTISYVNLQSLPQTIGLEYQFRINRFNRLSAMYGVKPPQIDQLQVSPGIIPGADYPIPVVRVVFDATTFFDFDKDTVRPESEQLLNVIAENMKRDVPDAQLLVLGHTDAIGTDEYNIDLSTRRASSVMQELVNRGVRPSQLATVGIGKNQPRAPNDTEEGRALNRRVEFMISANQDANVMLVERRRINETFLHLSFTDPPVVRVAARVNVLRLAPPTSRLSPIKPNNAALLPFRTIDLQPPAPAIEVKPTQPVDIKLNEPKVIEIKNLNEEFKL